MIPFLVTQPDFINQNVGGLTKSSVEIAQAAANYGALQVIFGVFMVFTMILILMFVYTLWSLNKRVVYIADTSQKIDDYLDGASNNTIGTNEANILVRREFNSLSNIFKYAILRIRLENHIADQTNTRLKVDRFVENEYNELMGLLSSFICNGRPLSEIVDPKDTDDIKAFILEQIYIKKEDFLISNLDQSVTLFMNGIKLLYLKKL